MPHTVDTVGIFAIILACSLAGGPAPPPPPEAAVVSSDEMRHHMAAIRLGVDGMAVEYTLRRYRGSGDAPVADVDDAFLVSESRQRIILAGDRFRRERRLIVPDPRSGGAPGDEFVETWDGYVHRDRWIANLAAVVDGPGAARARRTPRRGGVDGRFNQIMHEERPETYWLGLGRHDGRETRLDEMFDHPDLQGPFLRHDGLTEWRVPNPRFWDYDLDRFRSHVVRFVGVRLDDGSPRLREALVDQVSVFDDGRQALGRRTTTFSSDVHSEALPLPRRVVYTDRTTWKGEEPFWSRTVIDLIDVRPTPLGAGTFSLSFHDGEVVHDSRYGLRYTVGGNLLELPRRREGAILTDRPLRGDVGEKLPSYAGAGQIGELDVPPPRASWIAVGTDDLDLPAERKHDFGEVENMNWSSGVYHVFTVHNRSRRRVTITDIASTGKSVGSIWLGYRSREERGTSTVRGGISGIGTVLEPGASELMYVSMQFGTGLWRHAVTLTTDTGEAWRYQVSVTGVIDPIVRAFVRKPPAPGSRELPIGLRLITAEEEDRPVTVVEPDGVSLAFERWITLVPYHFVGGSPSQQLARFTLDLSKYQGEYPVIVKLRTAKGVETVLGVHAEASESTRGAE